MKKATTSILGSLIFCLTVSIGFAQTQDSKQLSKGQLIEVPALNHGKTTKAKEILINQKAILNAVIFEEDFESGLGNWNASGSWAVGDPTVGPTGGYNSLNAAGTNLTGDYPDNADENFTTPSITLPTISNGESITAQFMEWFETESGYDYGYVEISSDDGANWSTLSTRDGFSDWRETELDLTSYAGEVIILRFRLTSDNSDNYVGWFIDDVQITDSSPQPLSADITSLRSQSFPNIILNVRIDTLGAGFPDLTQENFTLYENGVLQTDLFNVTPPEQGGGVRRADIVFLMDNSGSMDDEQDDVEANVFDFVNGLSDSNVDYALGLTRYGGENRGNPIIEDNGSLTSDAEYFKNNIWMRNRSSGSNEPGYYSITEAANSFNFRPGSQRIFIIITDESPDQGGASINETLTELGEGDITLFALTETSLFSEFQPLTEATGGQYFDIYSSFGEILDFISTQVAGTYVVRYRSSNPVLDGSTRTVRVEVEYDGNTAANEATYVPGASPIIKRTSETITLSNEAQPDQVTIPIEAQITDDVAPGVQQAQLFYKQTQDPVSSYTSVEMTNITENIYRADIPESAVDTPGMDYYITATDGNTTSASPSTNPGADPFQIAVMPNYKPDITHTPVTEATVDQPINIAFNATDNTRELERVKLHYRRTGQLNYEVDIFEDFINQSDFLLTIPAEFVTNDGVEYYIEAEDDWGVASTLPKEDAVDEPYSVSTISPTIRLIDISLKKEDENSFSYYNPSEVVSVQAGAELQFRGIVEDSDGNPVTDQTIEVYNSFNYNAENNNSAVQTVKTDGEGIFQYPSNNSTVNTTSTPVGVRPFWFNVSTTDAAIPFALHVNNGENTIQNINATLKEEVDNYSFFKALRIGGENNNPFSDLAIAGQSYPTNDSDLANSSNNNFFLYYYTVYAGPTDKLFLLDSDISTGWLNRGYDLNQDRLDRALNNLPERFENNAPPATTGPVSTPPIIDDNIIGLETWSNIASLGGKAALCTAGVLAGGAPGTVSCIPIVGVISNAGFKTVINRSDLVKNWYCSDYTVDECVSLFSFGTFIGEVAIGGFSDPGKLSTLDGVLQQASNLNDLIEISEYIGVEPIQNEDNETKALKIDLVGGESINLTIPQKPELHFDDLQFDNPVNPSELNITVGSSRRIYESSTNAVSTPALQIRESSFNLNRIEGTDNIQYQTHIPVSQLPGFTGDPNSWDEPINVTGTSFETLWGETEGSFTGIGSKTLQLKGSYTTLLNSNSDIRVNGHLNFRSNLDDNIVAQLEVPDNAFNGNKVFVSMSSRSFSSVGNLEQPNLRPISPTIYIDANKQNFSKSAVLKLAFDSTNSKDTRVFRMGKDGMWYGIAPSSVNFENGTAKASIDSSGYYAILTEFQRNNSSSNSDEKEGREDSILEPNYPNPFSDSTIITYRLPETQHVNLTIYDILGNSIITLVDKEQEAANHFELFNANSLGLASGVYLYRLVTENDQQTEKMIFVR